MLFLEWHVTCRVDDQQCLPCLSSLLRISILAECGEICRGLLYWWIRPTSCIGRWAAILLSKISQNQHGALALAYPVSMWFLAVTFVLSCWPEQIVLQVCKGAVIASPQLLPSTYLPRLKSGYFQDFIHGNCLPMFMQSLSLCDDDKITIGIRLGFSRCEGCL